MGTFIRVPGLEITNPNAPQLVRPVYDVGVAGYIARYLASDLTAPAGSVIPEMPARLGDPLKPETGKASAVTVQDEANGRFIRTTVSRDAGGRLGGPTLTGSAFTTALVIRTASRERYASSTSGYEVQRNSSGYWQLGTFSGGTGNSGEATDGWSLIIAVGNMANSVIDANGARANVNITARSEFPFHFGPIVTPTAPIDMMEAVVWNRALTGTEIDTVRASIKAKYPFLP